jgi:hypothetical protein
MIKKIFICLSMLFIAGTSYADIDCTKAGSVGDTCACIMNNTIVDCQAKSPIKSICSKQPLNTLLRTNSQLALAQCEKYREKVDPTTGKPIPDECPWSIQYFTNNQCWNQDLSS